jgi:hypothetical protein
MVLALDFKPLAASKVNGKRSELFTPHQIVKTLGRSTIFCDEICWLFATKFLISVYGLPGECRVHRETQLPLPRLLKGEAGPLLFMGT